MKYSNCLIEALKAKLKDPKNVKIFSIDKRISRSGKHIMWMNTTNNTISHATWLKEKSNPVWYEYKIKTISLETFQKLVVESAFRYYKNNKKKAIDFIKKWNIDIFNINGVQWTQAFYDEDPEWSTLPLKKDYDKLSKFFGKKIPIKVIQNSEIRIIYNFEDLEKLPEGYGYKYITPVDEDFTALRIWNRNQYFESIL